MKRTAPMVKEKGKREDSEMLNLFLFVAGNEQNSAQARENLAAICESHLDGRYELTVIDVLDDFQAALNYGVLVTPTLVLVSPPPRVTVLGNLSDTLSVLASLRITNGE